MKPTNKRPAEVDEFVRRVKRRRAPPFLPDDKNYYRGALHHAFLELDIDFVQAPYSIDSPRGYSVDDTYQMFVTFLYNPLECKWLVIGIPPFPCERDAAPPNQAFQPIEKFIKKLRQVIDEHFADWKIYALEAAFGRHDSSKYCTAVLQLDFIRYAQKKI